MKPGKMMCLELLQGDIEAMVADADARQFLSNFLTLCSALYAAEAEDEQMTQEVVCICRRQLSEVHKKSIRGLEAMLNSSSAGRQASHGDIDSVLQKMKALADIDEELDSQFGQAPSFSLAEPVTSQGHERKLSQICIEDGSKLFHPDATADTNALIKDIVRGLSNLSDVALALRREEKEMRAVNRKLVHRLECLKQEAGSHPAIEVYTARYCHSPLATKNRREEYLQYACALERVIKKIKKTSESLRASSHEDLAEVEKHLPVLRTLSQAVGRLHDEARNACTITPDAHESAEPSETMFASNLAGGVLPDLEVPVAAEVAADETSLDLAAEKRQKQQLHQTLVSLASLRRAVDSSLSHVSKVMGEWSGDCRAAHVTAQGAIACTTGAQPYACAAPVSSLQKPPGGDDSPAVDTLKYLPLGDKECRRHLMGGTKLLRSAVEDLRRTSQARDTLLEARSVLDGALCRPFPETAICRLELIRLLTELGEDPEHHPPPPDARADDEKPGTSQGQKKEEIKRNDQAFGAAWKSSGKGQPRKLDSNPIRKKRNLTNPAERRRHSVQIRPKQEQNQLQVCGLQIPASTEATLKR